MRCFFYVLIIFILFSCEYKPPFSGVVPITINSSLVEWDIDDGISISDLTNDVGTFSLSLINLIDYESSTFSGGTKGNWKLSEDIADVTSVPSIANVITDPSDNTNKLLYIELKREPLAEYIYYILDVDIPQSNYVFRYNYRDISKIPSNIHLSIGLDTISDKTRFEEVIKQKEVGTAVQSLSFVESGNYHLRFGNSQKDSQIPTFSLYLDNIYIFKNSNHAISQRISVEQPGIYRISIQAKAGTSKIMNLKISGYSGGFTLTENFKEYSYFIRLDKGDTTIEVMPVDGILNNRIPGNISIKPPILEFHPDKSDTNP